MLAGSAEPARICHFAFVVDVDRANDLVQGALLTRLGSLRLV